MRWPGGRPVSTVRAVKSLPSKAIGPRTRCTAVKLCVVEYSTNIRAGRSLRLQITARPPDTSPAATPQGTPGGEFCARSKAAVGTAAPNRRKSRLFNCEPPTVTADRGPRTADRRLSLKSRRDRTEIACRGQPARGGCFSRGADDRVGHRLRRERANLTVVDRAVPRS